MTTTATTDYNQHLSEQLSWRYATKRFDPSRSIAARDWETLERSLLLAPSSFGLQPWRVIQVRSPELREQLRAASWNQPQVVEASHFVVLAAKTSFNTHEIDAAMELIASTRQVPLSALDGLKQMIIPFIDRLRTSGSLEQWSTHQAYIGLGFLLATAATLGIDACPLEGIVSTKYNELLGLESLGLHAKVACALGYRSPQDDLARQQKVRLPRDSFFIER